MQLLVQIESMPGGRPNVARDPKTRDRVVELFEKHLAPTKGDAVRRKSLFNYPTKGDVVQKTKLLKQLPLVYALCALTDRQLSGPMQVKALIRWNAKHHYVPHHGSRKWAETQIEMLYSMEIDLCKVSALGEKEWADLVGDVEKYPRLEVTDNAEVEEEDEEVVEEVVDHAEPKAKDQSIAACIETDAVEEDSTDLPSFMFGHLHEQGVTIKSDDNF